MRIQHFLLLAILAAAANAADLRVAHHSIRQDRSVVSPEEWQWNEGWPRVRQFFPRYFKPAATAHMFVQNTGDTALDITDVRFNGNRSTKSLRRWTMPAR